MKTLKRTSRLQPFLGRKAKSAFHPYQPPGTSALGNGDGCLAFGSLAVSAHDPLRTLTSTAPAGAFGCRGFEGCLASRDARMGLLEV